MIPPSQNFQNDTISRRVKQISVCWRLGMGGAVGATMKVGEVT